MASVVGSLLGSGSSGSSKSGFASTDNQLSNATGAVNSATGALVLNFGGINLGNQDIPLSQVSTSASNQAPTIGVTPLAAAAAVPTNYVPIAVIALAALALWYFLDKR